jgi:SecD/SecF fusion protein
MAVDTNVLIYERVREELWGGREIKAALRTGFNRAFAVIVDSHLTTLLTAAVLLQFGKGSVAGFALTMCFGLIANLFTGLTVTYAICSLWVRYRNSLGLGILAIFRNPKIDFIGMRYLSFSVSGVTLLIALFILFVYPRPQYAVDFQGGLLSEVRLLKDKPGSDQSKTIELALTKAGLAGEQARVQRIRGIERGNYLVRVALQADPTKTIRQGDVTYTQEHVEGALRSAFGAEEVQILGTESVSSEVGQQFQQIALFLVVASSIAILVYLWFRFELVFGVAAVLALLHDFIFTLGLLVLLKYQVSLDIVSGLMVLLGFSVNDTIVIFDRVRENSQTMYGKPFRTICNSAMNRSLSRTLITSGTVFLVMVIMFFFGGYSLKPFAVTMIIGSIVGTYSSDFIATPLVFWWNEREKGRLGELLGQKKTGPQSPERQLGAAAPVGATVQNRAQQPHRGRR